LNVQISPEALLASYERRRVKGGWSSRRVLALDVWETDGKRMGNGWETDGKRMGNGWETDGKRMEPSDCSGIPGVA